MMQDKNRRWQLIFSALALVIAAGAYILFAGGRKADAPGPVAPPAPFGSSNYNMMKTDTFVALVQQAYGSLVTSNISEGLLVLDMPHGNELTRDFFNGNDALLRFGLNDHGFALQYNPEQRSLKASFRISKANSVPVPNDVLIKIMDKTQRTHVDNKE